MLRSQLLELSFDFWERASRLRALTLSEGRKARLADTLIAQSCIDHDVAWISRDRVFGHFARYGGLVMASRSWAADT